MLEGGPGTVGSVHGACEGSIPVVLIKDSGRATDVLAYAYENLPDDLIENSETVHEGLMSEIKEKLPELKSDDAKIKIYEKIRCCMKQKKYVSYKTKFYYLFCKIQPLICYK